MTDAARPVGRPTKYDPAFCDRLVSLMSEGLSFMASCGEIGISKSTGQLWAEEHPEFSAAMTLGKARRAAFLEKRGINAESGPAVTFAIAALKNCNDEDFRERKVVEQTITLKRADELTDDDLAAIATGSGE